jgi:hypothetical protein
VASLRPERSSAARSTSSASRDSSASSTAPARVRAKTIMAVSHGTPVVRTVARSVATKVNRPSSTRAVATTPTASADPPQRRSDDPSGDAAPQSSRSADCNTRSSQPTSDDTSARTAPAGNESFARPVNEATGFDAHPGQARSARGEPDAGHPEAAPADLG